MSEIVVGVDGSHGSDLALAWARREAAVRGWDLVAVLSWDYLNQPGAAAGAPFDVAYGERSAREALAAYIEHAPDGDGHGVARAAIGQRVVCDLPANGLLGAAEGADLLVVGARGQGGLRRLALGSVSTHVLDRHHGDLVIVPEAAAGSTAVGGAGDPPGRIVVAIDGSEGAGAALRWAVEAARARACPLEVVHAWQDAPLGGGFPVTATVHVRSTYEHAARHVLDEALAGLDTGGIPNVEHLALEGPAVARILDHARDADLLVVSSRGLGGVKGLLLGSVSRPLVHKATVPVAVIKRHG